MKLFKSVRNINNMVSDDKKQVAINNLRELYKILNHPIPEINDELLYAWKDYIHKNREFCIDRRLSVMKQKTFEYGALNVYSLFTEHIEDIDLIPKATQSMRKIYNNLEDQEDRKIRTNASTVSTVSTSSSSSTDDMDMQWLMNVAGVVVNLYTNHKDSITSNVIIESFPPELRDACSKSIAHIQELSATDSKLDIIDVTRSVLNDEGVRTSIKSAIPLVTREHVKSTVDIILRNIQQKLNISNTQTGLPPMMASMLSMLNTQGSSNGGMPDLSALGSMLNSLQR
jgi:hypothetical protein